jgi:large subunit ribosomal protein L18e
MKRKVRSTLLNEAIMILRKKAKETNSKIWKDLAERLDKPSSVRAEVNVGKIAKITREGQVIFVPGKVLGAGIIEHRVIVGALTFSEQARKKIEMANGRALTVKEFVKEFSDGKDVMIVGG